MWLYDPHIGQMLWANKRGLAFWHVDSLEDLQGQSFSGGDTDETERIDANLNAVLRHSQSIDTWTLYPEGKPIQNVLEFGGVQLEKNRIGLWVEVVEQLQTHLSDTSLRLLTAAHSDLSLVTMLSIDGRIILQNPAAQICYGTALPDTAAASDLETRMISSADIQRIHGLSYEDGRLRFDAKMQTLDGPKLHAITARRSFDPVSKRPVILLREDQTPFGNDLYETQTAQTRELQKLLDQHKSRLLTTKARIDRALEVAAIWDWDIASDKLYFSPNFMHLLGYEPTEFIEKLRAGRFQAILHPDDFIAYQPILAGFLANPDQPISHEMRFQSKSGEYLWIQIEGKCFCDADGKPVRTAGLLTNITQKKQIEATLLTSQKLEAIGKLTGGIAHDFNNLLTVILGNVQLLEELGTLDMELTTEIVNSVGRGAELTKHLLAFAGKLSLNPEAVNIAQLATKMRATLLRILSETISVEYIDRNDLWNVYADAAQTEAAILNIALNARDAMPNGGTIVIKAENYSIAEGAASTAIMLQPGDYVRIAISDTGTGMGPDVVAKAFDPFFTTKGVGQGTGLGLSMVLGFSQQSGGKALIQSELGVGTTVYIYLPRATAQADVTSIPVDTAVYEGQGEHIHILEDNEQVSSTLSRLVKSLGYRTSQSGTVDTALLVAAQNIDIAVFIVDVVLPGGKSGVDFASEVRAIRPDAKLILVSGYPEAQLAREGVKDMTFTFLSKPFSRTQISEVLTTTLRDDT